jgi:hypothetical protein
MLGSEMAADNAAAIEKASVDIWRHRHGMECSGARVLRKGKRINVCPMNMIAQACSSALCDAEHRPFSSSYF